MDVFQPDFDLVLEMISVCLHCRPNIVWKDLGLFRLQV